MMKPDTAPMGLRARHPIRRYAAAPAPQARDDGDLKLFALSFTAFFVVIYSFIA